MTEVKVKDFLKTFELDIDVKGIIKRLDEVTKDIDYKSAIISEVEHLKKHKARR